jgi:hypothetical protein
MRFRISRVGGAAIALLLVASFAPREAEAAKEKFQRNKPHVNIGTIGQIDATTAVWLTVGFFEVVPQVRNADPARSCVGRVDLRLVDANDPTGTPWAELRDVKLRGNETATLRLAGAPGSVPAQGAYVVVLRDMKRFDGLTCVVRGDVEVRSDGGASRLLPIRPEDFVFLGGPPEDPPLCRPVPGAGDEDDDDDD